MIPLPQVPKVTKEEDNKAVFEILGFYPGYGITIGNSLRRVLLSSLEGAAITQVKIEGVSHEFSTISGVAEDVVMILLNLKKLTFKCFSDEPQTITLQVKGEKEVKAGDFKLTSEVELCNPKEHIATITKASTNLKIEARVEKGVGYETVEKREADKSEIGVIQIDSIFTPVKKVSLKVENMRVGKRTDFGLLKLEIETDGTITPKQALNQATDVLLGQFSVISEGTAEKEVKKVTTKETKTKKESGDADPKKMKVGDLKVSEKIKKVLIDNNIKTAGGLSRKSEKALTELEGLGDKAVTEIKKALKKLDIELK
ncbi:MAG: DNA-directed RNA polymerase subunit alpha [Parcubacteria group bacterium]|nr:DNA-directed RNA polymerase subunit alpha [Parcubacteria group bacterium]